MNEPLTKFKSAPLYEACEIEGTSSKLWVRQVDVLSALEGLKEELTKEHLHFKERGNIYMMDYTEQILLCVDEWFPFAKEEKGREK